MMNTDIKFDFNDILIKPAAYTKIDSRSEINPFDKEGMLPIFASPMDTVVDEESSQRFINNKIYSIIPRKQVYTKFTSTNKFEWLSFSLEEFIKYYINEKDTYVEAELEAQAEGLKHFAKMYVLIDCANGHMRKLFHAVRDAKKIYGERLVLMVGNIANPETYGRISTSGADYVRIGIGNGSGCTTTANGALGYPMGSLISECRSIANGLYKPAKIVADGGFKTYADIIKGLALGADYIMLGGMLNKCLESCAPCLIKDRNNNGLLATSEYSVVTYEKALEYFENGGKIYKNFRGMSTKAVQKTLGCKVLKTSEGIEKVNKVEYTLGSWTENMHDYLRSNMSYCNKRSLKEYVGKVEYIFVTQHAFNRFNK